MSLAALATARPRHPRLRRPRRARARRRRPRPRPDRPGGAAPVRRRGAGRRRAHDPGRHRDHPRGRGARRRARRPGRSARSSPTTRAGRRCPTSGSARAATPSASAWPCCAAWPTPAPTPPTARSRSSWPPCAACCSRRSRAWPTSSPSSSRSATRSPLDDLVRRLADAAYSRVDLVERRGEFAVRGGIVDVFPPTEEHPLRVELWGDDVEEIRSFSVADQRTLDKAERLWAPPCRELLLTDEVRERAAELGRAHPQLLELTDKIASGIAAEGMESLAPGARRRDGAARRPAARRRPPARARPRAGPLPGPRPRRHERGVPRGLLGRRGRWRHGPDRPRRGVVPLAGRRARARPGPRPVVVDAQPVRPRHEPPRTPPTPATARRSPLPAQPAAGLPRRRRAGPGRPRALARRRLPRRRRSTPATARPSALVEALGERDVPARLQEDGDDLELGRRHRHLRRADPRLRRRRRPDRRHHRRGHQRPEGLDARHAQDARAPQEADRPARAQGRRLRRPRAARRRPVRGDEAARGPGRDPRVPRPRVRRHQARRPARPALRPGRRARPGHPLRRRRAAQPRPARRRRLDQAQGPRPQGRARDRRRADQALRRPPGHQGLRLRPRHPVAARARGRLPVHRDPRPAHHGRRGQVRHAPGRADGPPGLRRRRLRQDRDRGARGVQGRPGRQAGRGAGADDAAGHPAPVDVRRADERLPGRHQGPEPLPERQGGQGGHRRPGRGHRSTSSSAPTACSTPTSGSRTSA